MPAVIDAIIPAAGIGSRMGSAVPKQYLTVAGKTILEHSVAALKACPAVARIIVAIRQADSYFHTLPLARDPQIIQAEGGACRYLSVLNALKSVRTNFVIVHDAARPLLHLEDLMALIKVTDNPEAAKCGALLCAPVTDTLKAENPQHPGIIARTISRIGVYRALTPQLSHTRTLNVALRKAETEGLTVTDEASALELLGLSPKIIIGRGDNFKLTTADDLELIESLLLRRSAHAS